MQIPGGHLASHWSARKLISLCLIAWGLCAIGCGLSQSFRQFEVMRFFLGVAESAVFPATLVLLANWFSVPNARAPIPTGCFASRWPWPVPRPSPAGCWAPMAGSRC